MQDPDPIVRHIRYISCFQKPFEMGFVLRHLLSHGDVLKIQDLKNHYCSLYEINNSEYRKGFPTVDG